MPRVQPEGQRSRERRAVSHRAEKEAGAGWRLKARLAVAVNEVLEIRHLKQREAAVLLGVPQPRVSALRNYRLDRFSVERLMEFLTSLGQDVDIRIRPHKRHGAASRDPEPAAPPGAPGRVSVHKG
jgi:predicted XRE-type DNA-binding protein